MEVVGPLPAVQLEGRREARDTDSDRVIAGSAADRQRIRGVESHVRKCAVRATHGTPSSGWIQSDLVVASGRMDDEVRSALGVRVRVDRATVQTHGARMEGNVPCRSVGLHLVDHRVVAGLPVDSHRRRGDKLPYMDHIIAASPVQSERAGRLLKTDGAGAIARITEKGQAQRPARAGPIQIEMEAACHRVINARQGSRRQVGDDGECSRRQPGNGERGVPHVHQVAGSTDLSGQTADHIGQLLVLPHRLRVGNAIDRQCPILALEQQSPQCHDGRVLRQVIKGPQGGGGQIGHRFNPRIVQYGTVASDGPGIICGDEVADLLKAAAINRESIHPAGQVVGIAAQGARQPPGRFYDEQVVVISRADQTLDAGEADGVHRAGIQAGQGPGVGVGRTDHCVGAGGPADHPVDSIDPLGSRGPADIRLADTGGDVHLRQIDPDRYRVGRVIQRVRPSRAPRKVAIEIGVLLEDEHVVAAASDDVLNAGRRAERVDPIGNGDRAVVM